MSLTKARIVKAVAKSVPENAARWIAGIKAPDSRAYRIA